LYKSGSPDEKCIDSQNFGTCDSHTDFKVKSQRHGAGAYCGGHLAAQLVKAQKVSHFEIKVTENVLHLRVMFLAASSRISFYF